MRKLVFLSPMKLGYSLFLTFAMLGCATRESPKPEIDATIHRTTEYEARRFGVQRQERDERRVDEEIAAELRRFGMQVSTGLDDVDIRVTYVDRWMWDVTMYLLSLEITFSDADTGEPLAVGRSRRVSLVRAAPAVMAREVIKRILRANVGLPPAGE